MDTIITYGAKGTCVHELCALARAAGVDIAQLDEATPMDPQTLDTIVATLGFGDQEMSYAVDPGQPIKGRVVDSKCWAALREKAAALTGLTVPPAEQAPAPTAGDAQISTGGSPPAVGGVPAEEAPGVTLQ